MAQEKYSQEKYKPREALEPEAPPAEPAVESKYRPKPLIKEVRVKARESMPRDDITPVKELRLKTPQVIGSIFDRVDFLKQRISEVQGMMETRDKLHEEIMKEIDADIDDRMDRLKTLTDIDDIRDFKLDIGILRKEKRQENVAFWKDLVELKTELTELTEELQMESKIADMFQDLKTE